MHDLSLIELRERIADGRMTSVEAVEALQGKLESCSAMVREHVEWALERQQQIN